MFIKKIIISGFRSYHYCEIEISPGQNVIVGPNGSGKSNIVLALEFVLTKNHIRLNTEEKTLLMCKLPDRNNNSKPMETYVEVHLDNTDERFPLKDATVVVKRRITLNNDQYYVNGNLAKCNEVMDMLEIAGFFVENPYYIVRQGLITDIAMSSSDDLLDILRSISGANGFDEKKAKSLRLLADAEDLIRTHEEKIQSYEDQLTSLNIDKEKVEQYQLYIRLKKYVLGKLKKYELRQLKSTLVRMQTELEEIEKEMQDESDSLNSVQDHLKRVQDEHDCLERDIETTQTELKCALALVETLYSELNQLEQKDSSQDDEEDTGSLVTTDQIHSIQIQLKKLETEVEAGAAELSALGEKKKEFAEQIQMLEQQEKNYLNLLTLLQEVSSDTDRDRMIRDNFLSHLETEINEQNSKIVQYRGYVNEFKIKTESIRKCVQDASNETPKKLDRIKTIKQEITKLCCDNKMAEIEKRKCMNELNKLRQESMTVENRLRETENWLDHKTGRMAIASKRSIENCMLSLRAKLEIEDDEEERYRLKMMVMGYHGQVVDCFQLTETALQRALEALFKNKMFYHIVSTETVASQLLTEMQKMELSGSFKFVAVNRLIFNQMPILEEENQCQPLAKYTQSTRPDTEEVNLTLKCLFNGLFVARNFQACWSLIQSYENCDFATTQGEMIDRFGVVTKLGSGQPTRYEKYQQWLANRQQFEHLQARIKKLESKRDKLIEDSLNFQRQITAKRAELAELKLWFQESTNAHQRPNESDLSVQLERLQEQTNAARAMLQEVETLLSCLLEKKHFWEQRIGRQVDVDSEKRQRQELAEKIDSLKHKYHKTAKEQVAKKNEIVAAQATIHDLNKRLNKLKYLKLNRSLLDQQATKIDQLKATLQEQIESGRKSIEQLNQKLAELEQRRLEMLRPVDGDNTASNLPKLREQYQEIKARFELLCKRYQEKKEQTEAIQTQITAARYFIEDAKFFNPALMAKLDHRFRQLETIDQINDALVLVNRQLKELYVGGKLSTEMLRLYDQIKEDMEKLTKSLEHYKIRGEEAKELIESTECQKNEKIMLTYKQVNVNFQKIFKRFFPDGCACLQFLTSSSSNSSSDNVDRLSGIEIILSFAPNQRPETRLMSLSGGQKALVSLAFIFALQLVDPMPFYAFDEADGNLDEMARVSLSEMVREMVTGTEKKQFIMTTFRTQLLQNADQVFLVKIIDGGVSTVQPTTKKTAIEFLNRNFYSKNEEEEEEREG